MKEIRVSNGRVTLVDDCDHRALSMLAWQASGGGRGSCSRYVSHGYRIGSRVKHILMHHMIARWMGLEILPGFEVDHKNREPYDNQRDNLRVVTQSINGHNTGLYTNNTSGVTGVDWHKSSGKWQASIRVQGRKIYLGLFTSFEDAVAARIAGERRYVGREYTANQPGPAAAVR